MKIIITSIIIGVLFVSSEASLYEIKSPINEKGRHKRSVSADIGIDLAPLSGIEITSKYSTDDVKVTCEAAGENLSYEWTTQNGELLNNEVAEGNVLLIHQVTKKNDRIFCCKAFNTAETLEKCERLPPRVLSSSPLEHTINSSAEMFCEVIGTDLDFHIKWKRADGLPLPNNAIVDGGLLKIPKLARTDTGIYVCVGSLNGKTEAFHPRLSLKVLSPPEIVDVRITGLDDDSNQDVTIQCITQPDETVTYEWTAHTEKHADIRENEKADGNSLSIENFGTDNEGKFCCIATNALGTGEKCVTIKPLVLEVYPEESDEVMSGESVTLKCRESTGYSNIKFHWARADGQPFASNIVESTNGSLTVRNITIKDEGRYNCSATKGVLSASTTTEIKVKTLPVVDIIPSNDGNIIAKLGDEVKLTCFADGHPQPSVQLQKFSPKTELYEAIESMTTKSAVYESMSLLESEAGLYLCLATNSAGSRNKTVQVVIKPPVLEVYPKQSHAVMLGSSVSLECRESVGYSNMKFSWSREDNSSFASNVVQSANGSLVITNITINEEGRYRCSATNGIASSSVLTEIEVRVLPVVEIPQSTDGYRTEKLGDEVKLTCIADGHPQPNLQWKKFSTETNSYEAVGVVTLKSTVYEIKSLSGNETGLYLCLAENSAGSSNETVQVVIKEPVLEVHPTGSHAITAGNSITLECRESVGYSNMKFSWSREDNSSFASNVVQSANGSLVITNITINEEGRYRCSATNGIASSSVVTEIEVRVLPVVEIPQSTDGYRTEKLGDGVKLTCIADGHPQPNLQWKKFSTETNSYEAVGLVTLKSTVYEIKSLSGNETGLYLCLAENSAGSSNETVQVVIKEPVLEVHPTGSHAITAGNSITLECRESVGYSNMKFSWSREDNSSFASNVVQSANGSLVITNITINEEGRYRCSATNGIASSSVVTEIEVGVLPVVEIPQSTDGYRTEKLGDGVKLTCIADGHPQPNLQWKKFSTETNSYETVGLVTLKSTVYEIKSLSGNETGLYLCLAENSAGSSNETVQVVIKEPVLEVHPTGSHAITAGNSITLECRESVGYSNMKFSWSREDNSSFASNVVQSANGSLVITNITINEEGRYRCSATNGIASSSVVTEIEVRVLPVVEIPQSTDGYRTEKLGDGVKLTCIADGHPQPNLQWKKFSTETNSYEAVGLVTLKSTVYEIKSLSGNETGLYLCLAENSAGSSNETVQVVIKEPVLEVHPTGSHAITAGNSITLECRESVGYSNMKFSWSREDNSSFASNVVQSANGSLVITNITINEEGRYRCSATNGIASSFVVTEIEVRVLPVVEIPQSTDGYRTEKLGDGVKLTCIADGHPQPNLQWKKFSTETNSYEAVGLVTLKSTVYEIKSLSGNETGLYLCLAENSAGSSNETVQVVIKEPVLEVHPTGSHAITAGNSITLECRESVGYSNMKFSWSREDNSSFASNVVQSVNGSLVITNITINEEGLYRCSATNGIASSSVVTEIEVRVLPVVEIPQSTDGYRTEKLGDGVKLTCIADGHPQPNLQWKKFSTETNSYEAVGLVTLKSTVYEIKSLSGNETGLYLCLAENSAGSSNETVQVVIKEPVLEVHPTGSHAITAGNSITLECRESVGYSNMKFSWSREDNSSFTSNVVQSVNGSLVITNITINEEGRYRCSATNGIASSSVVTEIEVRVLPVVEIPQSTDGYRTEKLGDGVKLTCIADGHPQPNLQWKKFSTETNSYEAVGVVTLKSTVYEIKSLSGNETGLYLCLAENSAGSSNETVQVVIKEPVLEVHPTGSHAITAGNSITLECRESVGYSNMKFSWSREDNSSFAPSVIQSANGALMITSITINEEGRYKCSATNGKAFASATAEIKVETLPVVEIIPSNNGNITFKLGDEVKLTCNADGHPQPRVQWQKFSPETELYQTVKSVATKSAVYEIMSLSENETGLYQCSVTNSAGSTHKTIQIIIKPLVLKVYPNVSLEVMAGKSVALECRESAGYSDIQIYWEREDGRPFASNVVQSAPGSLTITNITTEEKGRYKCSATKGVLSASASTEIKVKSLPVSAIHIEFKYSVFERLTMTCKATGEKLSYHWTGSNGYLLHNEIAEANVLSINGVTRENDRSFCCEASNAAGSLMKCLQLPTILLINQKLTSRVDSTAQLHCSVIGENSSQVRLMWLRADGSSVTKHASQHVSFFTFAKVTESDAGDYFCVGSLPDGTVVAREKTSLKVIPALSWWCSIVSCD